jgi:hypothetical protein
MGQNEVLVGPIGTKVLDSGLGWVAGMYQQLRFSNSPFV